MMAVYIIDSNVIITMCTYYYKPVFKGFWDKFDNITKQGEILSVKEVHNEINKGSLETLEWCKKNESIFHKPTIEELQFVSEIFKTNNFENLLSEEQREDNMPVADPFLIAKARCTSNGCVLTNENRNTGKRVKIPIVCDHFGIDCVNLDEFMQQEGWEF